MRSPVREPVSSLRPPSPIAAAVVITALGVAVAAPAHATPAVGSPDTATADPPVARPRTQPCVVPLFDHLDFADFSAKPFAYAPPAGCAGPWAKVVFTADFSVNAGRQYDRTANFWIGGVSIYFGTTQEPSRTVAPTWHVERDLTDYAALFTTAQPGKAVLGNLVNDTYTGIITGSAALHFYPLERRQKAPVTADVVLPLSDAADGGTVSLAEPTSALTRTFTLPRNVERAYLDVFAQSQGGDEFWYTCVPSDLSGPLQSCGGTAFREATVTIDGQPAGIAPVFPWLFTGAIDPYLWRPIPGVQALSFEPYRVDLSPFAGVLSDGAPHAVSIAVHNANNYFSVTGALLLYLDHGARQVTGAITVNTLAAAPTPTFDPQITTGDDGTAKGTVTTGASRTGAIAGVVRTSHGVQHVVVVQSVTFANVQTFDISAAGYLQDIDQQTRIATTTLVSGRRPSTSSRVESWPLALHYAYVAAADGSATQTTTIRQGLNLAALSTHNGLPSEIRTESSAIDPTDTLEFSPTGALVSHHGSSSHAYRSIGSDGCYAMKIAAVDGIVTAIDGGAGVCSLP